MDVNGVAIAGLVFGIISFLALLVYFVTVNLILPSYGSSSVPWNMIMFYISAFALLLILPLNITYSSLSRDVLENKVGNITTNTVFIITLMVLLSIVNILVGYFQYLNIGKNMTDTTEYLQLLLPANLLISVIAVSLITMNQLAHL
jgi:hypothetical protein